MVKTRKLVQDHNSIAKPQQFYWDSYQGEAQTSTEITVRRKCQEMSHGKANSVLGLWKMDTLVMRMMNEQEDFTEEDL